MKKNIVFEQAINRIDVVKEIEHLKTENDKPKLMLLLLIIW